MSVMAMLRQLFGWSAAIMLMEPRRMGWHNSSPEVCRRWKERLATRYSGDGYAVVFLSHSAVKYVEKRRSITFSSEPLVRTSGDGKTSWVLAVYIRRPLRWDDPNAGEITDADEEKAILARQGCQRVGPC